MKIIFLFLFGLILFFSFSYNIFLSIAPSIEHNNLIIYLNKSLFCFYVFEKKIYILVFGTLILTLLISSKNNLLKSLLSCQIFLVISRLSFCFICLVEAFTYLFYSFNEMQIYLNFQSLMYINIALIILIMFISILLVMLYEMPLRMIIKKSFKKEVNESSYKCIEEKY